MAYKLIATATITGSSNIAIYFTDIPQTFTDLELNCSTYGASNNGVNITTLTYNGDTTASGYSGRYLDTGNTGTPRGGGFAGASIYEYSSTTYVDQRVSTYLRLPNYTNNTTVKTWFADTAISGAYQGTYDAFDMGCGRSGTTGAVTSITLYGTSSNWGVGSTVSLYGIG